jgi:hypothetical protein
VRNVKIPIVATKVLLSLFLGSNDTNELLKPSSVKLSPEWFKIIAPWDELPTGCLEVLIPQDLNRPWIDGNSA